MEPRRATRKTGRRATQAARPRTRSRSALAALAALLALAAGSSRALAADDVHFTAQLDRDQISLDDSVSLKVELSTEGGSAGNVVGPTFVAPDFEVVNEYSSTFIKSYYDSASGRFGMQNTQQLTKVLKPTREGDLKISNIRITAGGKTLSAPDLVVHVSGAGAATPPPPNYGGSGLGLRGASKRVNGAQVLVRAEIDKEKAYKGEQIIVSYYLYRRVRVFNISVDKFPVLNGFLREDLEMPVLGSRLDSERVALDGVAYERSLLLRYAAYPLQEGKLKIDSVALKYNYYPNGAGSDNEDPFMNFFQQMTPRSGDDHSEQLTVDVLPVPDDGKPASFTGGVGDFNITSAVDKYEVRANEAVTLTVKIEGRGNVAAIGEPRAKWPDNVELYDSKGTAKAGKGGVGEKDFEFLLIPRTPGKVELPAMEFSYFDPSTKTYVTRKTEPISLNVQEPAPGSAAVAPRPKSGAPATPLPGGSAQPDSRDELMPLLPPSADTVSSFHGLPVWRWLYWLCGATVALFLGLVLYDFGRRGRASASALMESKARARSRSWDRLRDDAKAAANGGSWQEVIQSYELLAGVLFDALDRLYGLGARALPRTELGRILTTERGLAEPLWERLSRLLEFAELVRFASAAGAVPESKVRQDLARWVAEGETLVSQLEKSAAK